MYRVRNNVCPPLYSKNSKSYDKTDGTINSNALDLPSNCASLFDTRAKSTLGGYFQTKLGHHYEMGNRSLTTIITDETYVHFYDTPTHREAKIWIYEDETHSYIVKKKELYESCVMRYSSGVRGWSLRLSWRDRRQSLPSGILKFVSPRSSKRSQKISQILVFVTLSYITIMLDHIVLE